MLSEKGKSNNYIALFGDCIALVTLFTDNAKIQTPFPEFDRYEDHNCSSPNGYSALYKVFEGIVDGIEPNWFASCIFGDQSMKNKLILLGNNIMSLGQLKYQMRFMVEERNCLRFKWFPNDSFVAEDGFPEEWEMDDYVSMESPPEEQYWRDCAVVKNELEEEVLAFRVLTIAC